MWYSPHRFTGQYPHEVEPAGPKMGTDKESGLPGQHSLDGFGRNQYQFSRKSLEWFYGYLPTYLEVGGERVWLRNLRNIVLDGLDPVTYGINAALDRGLENDRRTMPYEEAEATP